MGRLRLRAADSEDLKIIAVHTQDALVPVTEMSYLPDERRFILALNRFCWESACDKSHSIYTRTNAALSFNDVTQIQLRGFELKQRGRILNLLTILYDETSALLHFADHCDIRLTLAHLDCRLDDFGEPWPTRVKPSHNNVIPAKAGISR